MSYAKYKYEYCKRIFMRLAEDLDETHELVCSCNKDRSLYLIPKGTIDQLTYYGKPENSYRLSDHWNWYANITKCKDEKHVQCYNIDLKKPAKRVDEKATKPLKNVCIAYYGSDHKYHTLIGDMYDKQRKRMMFRDIFTHYNENKLRRLLEC